MKNNKALGLITKYGALLLLTIAIIAVGFSGVEIYKEEILHIDPDVEYKEQKTLYFSSERIDTLNPVISKSEDVYYLSKLIYSSLFEYDENLALHPVLAESYEINTEKAYIEITLRDDIKWHNGNKLKAADVSFTINAMKTAGAECPYYSKIQKINSAFARSKNVVTIYFNNNYNCSLDELVFPIVPSTQYSSVYQFNSAVDFKPIGTGQYEYKSYNKLKQLRLVPNEEYFGKAAAKNITVTILPEKDLASNMMEINSVSCYTDSSANRKSIAQDRNLKIYDIPSNNVEFIVFNTSDVVLSRKDVRQAVAYGINREKILSNAYMGDGILTDTIYYPNFLNVKDKGTYYSYNLNHAKEMLMQAGYKDTNGDGFLEDTFNVAVEFDILVNEKNATRNSAAKHIKADLEQLGIRANLISLPEKDYLDSIRNKDFDILLTGYTIEESYDLRSFYNGKNEWGYSNYDLQMAAVELDRLYSPEEYKNNFTELKELLLDELPYYALCYKKMSIIGLPTFEAEKMPMFNNIYMNCDTWSWSKVIEKNNSEEK